MLSLRYVAAALVFLAVIPLALHVGVSTYFALSFTCLVLISATLYLALGPSDGAHQPTADAR